VILHFSLVSHGGTCYDRSKREKERTMFVNLTPHVINIIVDNNNSISIPPSGIVARVSVTYTPVRYIDGISIQRSSYGEVTDLPNPQKDTIFIVSNMVLSAIAHTGRTDVLAPGELVRDVDGRAIGCRGLQSPIV
jgi:hypothetical protein